MKNKKLQMAFKQKKIIEETMALQKKLADEIKVYLSYPEDQLFSIDYIYGILCGVSDELMEIIDLIMKEYLSLINELKK